MNTTDGQQLYETLLRAGDQRRKKGLLKQLGIQMTLTESVLEEEGMHVFEWWGGEYHPLEELIAKMDEVKKKQKTGVTD